MDYKEAMNFLGSSMKFGSRLGLERMEKLYELLGRPSQDIPVFHIAGTNGKGSTSTMIANSLAAAGYRVGLYTSPFIHRFSERIRVINGRSDLDRLLTDESTGEISEDEISQYISEIKKKVEIMTACGFDHPTEFELVTAAAFMHFENLKCDYYVLETGLGGRLDSTNIVKKPLRCIITPIGYDHMDRLGNTIEKIAFEKAGIIKQDSIVIAAFPKDYAGEKDAEAIKSVIEKKCGETGISKPEYVTEKNISLILGNLEGQKFLYRYKNTDYTLHTALLGDYQPLNCAMAFEACFEICGYENIRYGLEKTRWPARLEILRKEMPLALLDGAHNVQGVKALVKTLGKIFRGEKIVFLCGVMKDKNYRDIIDIVTDSKDYLPAAFFCTMPSNERALDPRELERVIRKSLDKNTDRGYNTFTEVFSERSPGKAVSLAFEYADKNRCVLVAFGSLYMAGTIRDYIRNIR